LTRSLGGLATKYSSIKEESRVMYGARIQIKHNPFKLSTKANKWRPSKKLSRGVVSLVELIDDTHEYYCLNLTNETHTYITRNYTPTHNSTLMEYWMLFIAFKQGVLPNESKPIQFVLGVFSEEKLQRGFIKNIRKKWEDSVFLQKYLVFPRERDLKESTVIAHRIPNKNGKQKIYKLSIQTGTILGSLRGIREGTIRPQIIITDDILSTDMAKSDAKKQAVSERFNQDIAEIGQIDGSSKFIFIGTPVAPDDLLHELIENPEWITHRYPVCKAFPVPKEEFESNWADVKTFEVVQKAYNKAKHSSVGVSGFYQEMMLETVDLSSILVSPHLIQRRNVGRIKANLDKYNIYITTDFSMSEKSSADLSTIGVWAVPSNGAWILIDGSATKEPMRENVNNLFKFIRKYTVGEKQPSVAVEANGTQKGYIDLIDEQQDIRGVYFTWAVDKNRNMMSKSKGKITFDYGIATSKDKTHRFVTGVLPKFEDKKVFIGYASEYEVDFKALVDEMLDELSKITMKTGVKGLKHDDACSPYNTLIDTPTGQVKIGDLRNGDRVLSFSREGTHITKVKDFRMTGLKEIYNLEMVDGTILSFSKYHPLLTQEGYKLMCDIRSSDKIIKVDTSVKVKDSSYQGNRKTAYTVKKSLLPTRNPVKMLKFVGTGIIEATIVKKLKAVKNVVWSLFQKVKMTNTVQTSVEQNMSESTQSSILRKSVTTVDPHSKALYLSLDVETNAKELKAMKLNDYEEGIVKIWKSPAVPTYNFEVATFHNYQVEGGYVSHNCDLLNQLSQVDIEVPNLYDEELEKALVNPVDMLNFGFEEDTDSDTFSDPYTF